MRWLVALVIFAALVAPARAQEAEAHALEERLIAPCCWQESLATHDSPLARELREEIDARLARGESPAAIEADIVGRYGDRILAIPPGSDTLALVVVLATLIGLGVLVATGRRWARAAAPEPAPTSDGAARSVDEARLDRELEAFDE